MFFKKHDTITQKQERKGIDKLKKKIIYRKPLGKQDRFIISTTHAKTKNVRRSLELCKEMYFNRVNFSRVSKKDAYANTIACEEVALDGVFKGTEWSAKFRFVLERRAVARDDAKNVWKISVQDEAFSPDKLRMKVYAAILCGARGIEYDSVYDGGITKESTQGPLFRYIEELNYRVGQYGRTLMALKNVGVYCSADVLESYPEFAAVAKPISESKILAEQELAADVAIGEFEDSEGNGYLLYQNCDCTEKKAKAFGFKLKKDFRVYRVNPHDGKQVFSKESADSQKIMMMPGDGDLLRYQDVEEEACLIEYAIKK